MPLIDHLMGDLEIQERRPRSWHEPRRNRLSFVRPHNVHSRHSSTSSNPDDWALAPRPRNARFYHNDAETWDLRRLEAQQRFNDATIRQRDQEHNQRIHFIHQMYGPPPDLRQIHNHGREEGLLEGRIQEIRPRGHHRNSSDDEIVEVVDGNDSDDDPWDDQHHRRPRREPLSIEHDRDHGRAIHDLTGKGKKKNKGKHSKEKKGHKKARSHSDSDSDADDRKAFMEGVKAGIRVSRDRGSGHGGGSDRGSPRPRRRFMKDDDSDDSMTFRPRRRSRSRGKSFWGM